MSPGATAEEIAKTFEILRGGGGGNVAEWYVVGDFGVRAAWTKVGGKSSIAIVAAMRENLNRQGRCHVYDTVGINVSHGINLYANLVGQGLAFEYSKERYNRRRPAAEFACLPIDAPFTRM